MTKYRIKRIIPGEEIDSKYKGLSLIATPNGAEHTQMVTYGHEYMMLPKKTKPLFVRTFNDKFGRDKQYHLFYHIWKPTTPKAVREVSVMGAVQNTMTLEKLQEMKKQIFK